MWERYFIQSPEFFQKNKNQVLSFKSKENFLFDILGLNSGLVIFVEEIRHLKPEGNFCY